MTEKVHQLLAAHTEHAAGHHRLDRGLRWTAVEAGGIVARKLTLEREPCDMLPIITDAIRYILEAPFGDEAEPSCACGKSPPCPHARKTRAAPQYQYCFSRISVPSSVAVLETCSYHFPAQLVDMVDDGLLALG